MVLRLRVSAVDWSAGENEGKAAKCIPFGPHGTGEDPWFEPEQYEDAMAICNGDYDGRICPLRQECLQYACANNEHSGVWGGMLPHDRHEMRQEVKADNTWLAENGRRKIPLREVNWEWHEPTEPLTDLPEEEMCDEEDEDLPMDPLSSLELLLR